MKTANRQAKDRRDEQFEALAAFANMGDGSKDMQKFRLKYPDFFPLEPSGSNRVGFQNMTDWLYTYAEEFEKDSADVPDIKEKVTPALLWYRDLLRAVWSNNDRKGGGLYVLYGYEAKARAVGIPVTVGVIHPHLIPGQFHDVKQNVTSGLPQGEPIIDAASGAIDWKFGCEFQQSVYELMLCRWRAKVCPEDGVYFVAGKTAQTFCSTKCSGEAKKKRALDYWNTKGNADRKRKTKKARAK
jgi:hypothetical protein